MKQPPRRYLHKHLPFPRVVITLAPIVADEACLVWNLKTQNLSRGWCIVNLSHQRAHWIKKTLEGRIIETLLLRQGGFCSDAEMIDAVWVDDPDGGPLTAKNIIKLLVWRMRRDNVLAPVGLEIVNVYGRRFYLAAVQSYEPSCAVAA